MGQRRVGVGWSPPNTLNRKSLVISYNLDREKGLFNVQEAVLVGAKMGEDCMRLWQAFSKGKERGHPPSELQSEKDSARGQRRGLDCFLMCPWRILLLHHLCPAKNTEGQERHRSSTAKVKPHLMV